MLKGLKADYHIHGLIFQRQSDRKIREVESKAFAAGKVIGSRILQGESGRIESLDFTSKSRIPQYCRPVAQATSSIDHSVARTNVSGCKMVSSYMRFGSPPVFAQHIHVNVAFPYFNGQRHFFTNDLVPGFK